MPLPKDFVPAPLDQAVAQAMPGWFAPPYGMSDTMLRYGAQGVRVQPNPAYDPKNPDSEDRYILWPSAFESRQLITAEFPLIGRHYVHRLIVPILRGTLLAWEAEAREKGINYPLHAGTFAVRRKRTADELSLHALGIATDLNPEANPLQARAGDELICDMPIELINAFTSRGWTWGGAFHGRKDPMHFQFAGGA